MLTWPVPSLVDNVKAVNLGEDGRIVVLPDTLNFDEGAALTVNYLTVYRALTHSVKVLQPGQKLIISGATGSVGHALIQVGQGARHRPHCGGLFS